MALYPTTYRRRERVDHCELSLRCAALSFTCIHAPRLHIQMHTCWLVGMKTARCESYMYTKNIQIHTYFLSFFSLGFHLRVTECITHVARPWWIRGCGRLGQLQVGFPHRTALLVAAPAAKLMPPGPVSKYD